MLHFPQPYGPDLLRTWLDDAGPGSRAALARSLGHDERVLYKWLSGHRRPGPDTAYAIQRITKGAVPMAAWVCHETAEPCLQRWKERR